VVRTPDRGDRSESLSRARNTNSNVTVLARVLGFLQHRLFALVSAFLLQDVRYIGFLIEHLSASKYGAGLDFNLSQSGLIVLEDVDLFNICPN
jgi:hypothetical protein